MSKVSIVEGAGRYADRRGDQFPLILPYYPAFDHAQSSYSLHTPRRARNDRSNCAETKTRFCLLFLENPNSANSFFAAHCEEEIRRRRRQRRRRRGKTGNQSCIKESTLYTASSRTTYSIISRVERARKQNEAQRGRKVEEFWNRKRNGIEG